MTEPAKVQRWVAYDVIEDDDGMFVKYCDVAPLLSKASAYDRLLKEFEEKVNHSCSCDGDEFGIFPCCGNADFRGHKETCHDNKLLKEFAAFKAQQGSPKP